jgi:adenylate kinase
MMARYNGVAGTCWLWGQPGNTCGGELSTMNLILIGAQGSGKGTQAQMLEAKLGLMPCASGDLLREEIAKGTPLGREAKGYYDRGDLVPDDIVVGMILARLRELDDEGLILDGFPRTIPQARKLDEQLATLGQAIDGVVYLAVPREQLLDRLSHRYVCRANGHVWNTKTRPPARPGICDYDGSELYQRSDDTFEKITHRLDIFFSETIQLLSYYEDQGKLIPVDGTTRPEEVTAHILAGLAAHHAAAVLGAQETTAQ